MRDGARLRSHARNPGVAAAAGRDAEGRRARLDGRRGTPRLRRGLVIAEMALALPLLVAAGAERADRPTVSERTRRASIRTGVLTMRLPLPEARYPSRRRLARGSPRAVVERLRAMPGVDRRPRHQHHAGERAATRGRDPIEIDGRPNPDPPTRPRWTTGPITAGVLRGAADSNPFAAARFTRRGSGGHAAGRDRQRVARAAPLARRGSDRQANQARTRDPWLTVVGVVGDVIHDWFGRRNYPTVYRPFRQAPTRSHGADRPDVRRSATGSPPSARAAVRAVDPSQPVFEVQLDAPGAAANGRSACSTSARSCWSSAAWRCCSRSSASTASWRTWSRSAATRSACAWRSAPRARDVLRLTVGQTATADRGRRRARHRARRSCWAD